jgi:hypothetical protein
VSNLPRLDALLRRGTEQPAEEEPAADPTALTAAARSLLLAGAGPDWWPYAVLVSPTLVAVHLAGAHCPKPAPPWQPGPDERLWIGDREEVRRTAEAEGISVDASAAKGPRPVLLGMYDGGFVYIDVARAPGPLLIAGAEPWATRVRELLDTQLPSGAVRPATSESTPAAYWPIQVAASQTISLLGSAIARVLKYPERLAASMATRRSLPGPGASPQAPELALVSGPVPTAVSAFGPAATAALAAATAPSPAPSGSARQPAHAAPRKPSPPQVPRHPVPQRRPAPPTPPVIDFEAPAVSARAAESGAAPGRATPTGPSTYQSRPASPPPSGSAARPPTPPPPVHWDDVAVSSADENRR